MADWVYESTRATIGKCLVTIDKSDENDAAGWNWVVTNSTMTAQGFCQSYELAQERVGKLAMFISKEM